MNDGSLTLRELKETIARLREVKYVASDYAPKVDKEGNSCVWMIQNRGDSLIVMHKDYIEQFKRAVMADGRIPVDARERANQLQQEGVMPE